MNFEKGRFIDEFEPYSTLSSYRTKPKYGPILGIYTQCEMLNKALYDRVLPEALGYESFEKNAKENGASVRAED